MHEGVNEKNNLPGGYQPALGINVWSPNRRSYRFRKHWAAGNHSAICIWGKIKKKAIRIN